MTHKFYAWLTMLIANDNLVKFYQCKQWRALRIKAIKRDNNECQMCKAKGKYHVCENVHHIQEVRDRPDLALSLDNLMCLCINCHNEVHERYSITERKIEKPFTNFDAKERW